MRGQVLLTHLDQIGGENRRREREESKPRKEREKWRDFRVRSPHFSLSFPMIEPMVSGGARGRVHPHDKGFAERPELGTFDKLREVWVFLLLGLILV